MADSDDKQQDGAHKKTLSLKGGPSVGARPGMGRGPRTVVVEKRTRVVPRGGASAPAAPHGSGAAPAQTQGGSPRNSGGQPARADGRAQRASASGPGTAPRNAALSTAEAEARA